MKYKFYKLKNSNVWLLEANDYETIKAHYDKYCAPIIKDGTLFIIKKYTKFEKLGHPDNMFAKGFESLYAIMKDSNISLIQALTNFEIQILKARNLSGFPKYLYHDLRIYGANEINEYDDVYETDKLSYPDEENMNISSVRYLQWVPNGHWYAKIGIIDIVDEKGNQKWNTKEEAENAAEEYIKKQ